MVLKYYIMGKLKNIKNKRNSKRNSSIVNDIFNYNDRININDLLTSPIDIKSEDFIWKIKK
jgi:hypothetical protein